MIIFFDSLETSFDPFWLFYTQLPFVFPVKQLCTKQVLIIEKSSQCLNTIQLPCECSRFYLFHVIIGILNNLVNMSHLYGPIQMKPGNLYPASTLPLEASAPTYAQRPKSCFGQASQRASNWPLLDSSRPATAQCKD